MLTTPSPASTEYMPFDPVPTWTTRVDADVLRTLSSRSREDLMQAEIEDLRRSFKESSKSLLKILKAELDREDANRTPDQTTTIQHAIGHCVAAIMTL